MRLSKKDAEKLLEEMSANFSEKEDELTIEIEELRHNIYLFQSYISRCKEIIDDSKLKEAKSKQNAVNELIELYESIKTVQNRIDANIERIKELLKTKPRLSETFVEDTNQSFCDMFTNYEITIARYSKFLYDFEIKLPSKNLKEPIRNLTKAMDTLDSVIVDFNNYYPHRLLRPFEESEIAETIHVYGFEIVSEKDWSKLVKYRG